MDVVVTFFEPFLENIERLIAFLAALLAIIVVLTQKQLRVTKAKPKYVIGTNPDFIGATLIAGDIQIDRKSRNKLNENHLFYPVVLEKGEQKKYQAKRHIFYFPISIENTGNTQIENLQIQLEYPEQCRVDYEAFEKLLPDKQFFRVLENGEIEVFEYVKGESSEQSFKRKATSVLGFTQVLYDVPLLRPGEKAIIGEAMQFTHQGPAMFSEMYLHNTGYDEISRCLKKVEDIKNNFPVIAHFRSSDHKPIVRRAIVFSIHEELDATDASVINEYAKAHWMGRLPSKGSYFSPPLGFGWLLRRLRLIGGLGRSWSRDHPLLLHGTKASFSRDDNGEVFSIDDPKSSVVGHGQITLPNIDFFNIPKTINSHKRLMEWIGFWPAPKFLGGAKSED